MVLSGDLKANGHVVLGLNVDAKTIFHGAQTHRGGLAVNHGHLHVEARVDDTIELTQALDDHSVLLLNDVAGVGEQQQQDDDGNQKAGKGGDDTGKQHGLSSDRHTLALGYPSKEIVHNKKAPIAGSSFNPWCWRKDVRVSASRIRTGFGRLPATSPARYKRSAFA